VIVTITVLVIVEVLSVQDIVALAWPSYAAAGSAEANARSTAIARASRSRRFIAIPPSVLNANNQGFSDRALSEDTQHSYRTPYFSVRIATFRPDIPGVSLLPVTSFVALVLQPQL
jgi:hypothetical protein